MNTRSTLRQAFAGIVAIVILFITSCTTQEKKQEKADPVEANIKMYSNVWDEIMNKGKLELFNDSNFTMKHFT
jgi:hypothetical protein